ERRQENLVYLGHGLSPYSVERLTRQPDVGSQTATVRRAFPMKGSEPISAAPSVTPEVCRQPLCVSRELAPTGRVFPRITEVCINILEKQDIPSDRLPTFLRWGLRRVQLIWFDHSDTGHRLPPAGKIVDADFVSAPARSREFQPIETDQPKTPLLQPKLVVAGRDAIASAAEPVMERHR